MDFEALGAWFSWILVPLDHVFWFPPPVSRDMRGACQVADLTLMIMATRGRSGRPNHMRSHIGNPKTMTPVNLRRLPGDLHSVAKHASFNIAFGVDLGSFGKPKSMPKFDFRAIFSDVIFERNFTSEFGSCLKVQNQKNSNFPLEKQWFSQNQLFR